MSVPVNRYVGSSSTKLTDSRTLDLQLKTYSLSIATSWILTLRLHGLPGSQWFTIRNRNIFSSLALQ